MQTKLSAKDFLTKLKPLQVTAGIRMAELFSLAKSFTQMQLQEIEKLL
ncbi:MAG: hypothetical protein JWQ30_716, partial [Sediminibacterium sp.]|nr:hypothetical protein [Sediminibacterium sp.]